MVDHAGIAVLELDIAHGRDNGWLGRSLVNRECPHSCDAVVARGGNIKALSGRKKSEENV